MKQMRFAQKAATVFGILFCMSNFIFAQVVKPMVQPAQAAGPHKTNIAVINLKSSSGVSSGEAELISDRLRGELFNTGKVNVMERDQMQEILKEQGFQQSGACSNEACMVEIGQLLGVEQLVSGSLGKVGSMFLVNLRIIDVKTAKITKVVSKDIKGSIEEVVGELSPIAAELVGVAAEQPAPTPAPAPAPQPQVIEQKPVVQEQSQQDVAVEQPKEEKKPEVVPDEWAEKNKNRSGIRFAFNLFGNDLVLKTHEKYTDPSGNETTYDYSIDDNNYTSVSRPLFINPQLKFSIKAGQYITIDLGPSWTYGNVTFNDVSIDTTQKWDDYFNVIGLATGVNFVKRWYPLKINAGLLIDLNYLNFMREYTKTATGLYSYGTIYDTTLMHSAFNVSVGFRVGAEILMGKHFGISTDFVYRYSSFTTISQTDTYSDGSTAEWTYDIDLPSIAFGLGFNIYY